MGRALLIEIHEVRRGQLEELAELCREHAEYDRGFEPGIAALPDDLADRLERLLFTEGSLRCFVAEQDGRLLGYVSGFRVQSTWRGDEYWTMECLYVAAGQRGNSIGARLIEAMRATAEADGVTRLRWQTPLANDGSRRFYEGYGAETGLAHADKRTYTLPLSP